jgi:hypothetical protein
MRKYTLALTLVLLVCGIALAQETNTIATRFGALTVNGEGVLLFKGTPVQPAIQANNSLDLGKPFQIGSSDVVLVTDNGGTACPATLYFVTLTKSGAKVTHPFGTCSELIETKRTGDSILVSMPGFVGPFQSKRAQNKAARENHVFIYRAGVVTEHGKSVK